VEDAEMLAAAAEQDVEMAPPTRASPPLAPQTGGGRQSVVPAMMNMRAPVSGVRCQCSRRSCAHPDGCDDTAEPNVKLGTSDLAWSAPAATHPCTGAAREQARYRAESDCVECRRGALLVAGVEDVEEHVEERENAKPSSGTFTANPGAQHAAARHALVGQRPQPPWLLRIECACSAPSCNHAAGRCKGIIVKHVAIGDGPLALLNSDTQCVECRLAWVRGNGDPSAQIRSLGVPRLPFTSDQAANTKINEPKVKLSITPVELEPNVHRGNLALPFGMRANTGAVSSVLPRYLQRKKYVVLDGVFQGSLADLEECDDAQLYTIFAAMDTRLLKLFAHKLHVCTSSCTKYGHKICRHQFYRLHKFSTNELAQRYGISYTEAKQRFEGKSVTILRHGKKLQNTDEVETDNFNGRQGRYRFTQTHPTEPRSSVGWLLMGMRCNVDLDVLDRVAVEDNLSIELITVVAELLAAAPSDTHYTAESFMNEVWNKKKSEMESMYAAHGGTGQALELHVKDQVYKVLLRYSFSGNPLLAQHDGQTKVMVIMLHSRKGINYGQERTLVRKLQTVSKDVSMTEQRRKEIVLIAIEAARDTVNLSYYTGEYALKDATTIEAPLVKQHEGMVRLVEELHDSGLPQAEIAARKIIRAYTAEKNTTFRPACTAAKIIFEGRDAITTEKYWTLFTSFLFNAADMMAARKRGDCGAGQKEEDEVINQEDVLDDDNVKVANDAMYARKDEGDAVPVSLAQKDQYLHRIAKKPNESIFACMGILHFSEVCTDVPLEQKDVRPGVEMQHPKYKYGGDYGRRAPTKCICFDPTTRAPFVPVPEGRKLFTADLNKEQAAMQKLALLLPYVCNCYTCEIADRSGAQIACKRHKPFEGLSDGTGQFEAKWQEFIAVERSVAQVFRDFCDRQKLYPSWALAWQVAATVCDGNPQESQAQWERALVRGYTAMRTCEVADWWDLVVGAGTARRGVIRLDHLAMDASCGQKNTEDFEGEVLGGACGDCPAFEVPEAELSSFVNYTKFNTTVKVKGLLRKYTDACSVPQKDIKINAPTGHEGHLPLDEQTSAIEKFQEAHNKLMQQRSPAVQQLTPAKWAEEDRPLFSIWAEIRGTSVEEQFIDQYTRTAERLCEEQTLNAEQEDALILHVDAIAERVAGNMTYQNIVLLIGPGGAGKTHVQNHAIRELVIRNFGKAADAGFAPTNETAAVLGRESQTLHTGSGYKQTDGEVGLSQGLCAQRGKTALKSVYRDKMHICVDEASMAQSKLMWCHQVAITEARREEVEAALPQWTYEDALYGLVPSVEIMFDNQQLPPVGGYGNAHHEVYKDRPCNDETRSMWNAYRKITNVVKLVKSNRFHCELQRRLNEQVRLPDTDIDTDVWDAFLQREIGHPDFWCKENKCDKRLLEPGFVNHPMYVAQEWALVARQQRQSSVRTANEAQEMLYWVQAVDAPNGGLDKELAYKLLQFLNVTTMARLCGLVGVHKKQWIRVSNRLEKHLELVQGAKGKIVDVIPAQQERPAVQEEIDRGYRRLRHMPQLLVFFPHLEGKDFGYGDGVFVIEAVTLRCAPEISGQKIKGTRTQLPVWPEGPGTTQNAQGKSKDFVIMDLAPVSALETEEQIDRYFMHLYLMLSRCRTMVGMLWINGPANLREIVKRGPPRWVLQEEYRLAVLNDRTITRLEKLRKNLRWRRANNRQRPPLPAKPAQEKSDMTLLLEEIAKNQKKEDLKRKAVLKEMQRKAARIDDELEQAPKRHASQPIITIFDFMAGCVTEQVNQVAKDQNWRVSEESVQERSQGDAPLCGYIAAELCKLFRADEKRCPTAVDARWIKAHVDDADRVTGTIAAVNAELGYDMGSATNLAVDEILKAVYEIYDDRSFAEIVDRIEESDRIHCCAGPTEIEETLKKYARSGADDTPRMFICTTARLGISHHFIVHLKPGGGKRRPPGPMLAYVRRAGRGMDCSRLHGFRGVDRCIEAWLPRGEVDRRAKRAPCLCSNQACGHPKGCKSTPKPNVALGDSDMALCAPGRHTTRLQRHRHRGGTARTPTAWTAGAKFSAPSA